MTIREFWHDIKDRLFEEDHRRHPDDYRMQRRDWRDDGEQRPQREHWGRDYRDNDRDSYHPDYDRTGADRHYRARGIAPMGVHGIDQYRDEPRSRSYDDRYASQFGRDYGHEDRERHERGQYEQYRWGAPETRGALGTESWPDRYSSESAVRDYRGRGPSNWQRSDSRLYEDVCECLMEDDELDASNIEVKVERCEVTLTGTVETRRDKRRAEDLIERVSGVRDVHNHLQVQHARDTFLGTRDALRGSHIGH